MAESFFITNEESGKIPSNQKENCALNMQRCNAMQKEDMFKKILESVPSITTIKGLVSIISEKLLFCFFCDKYFINQYELKTHIRNDHAEKLTSIVKKRVDIPAVEEETERIYICPHCDFVVGNNCLSNPISKIASHIENHFHARGEPPRISFLTSSDEELIQRYIKGSVEIELFICNICKESFGVSETFLEHLVSPKHTCFLPGKFSDEDINLIQNCCSIFLEKNKDKEDGKIKHSEGRDKTNEPLKPVDEPAEKQPEEGLKPPVKIRKTNFPFFPGQKFSKTAQSNEIDKGLLSFPPRLKVVFSFTEQINVQFHLDHEETLPYVKSKGLSGLKEWYLINAVEPGDKISFLLLNQNPANIKIWTEWEKHLNYIIKCPSEDFKWQYLPIRDCLFHVFAKLKRPAHYRELYAHISRHRDIAISSVIGTLSKYRGILFDHTGDGEWKILQKPTINISINISLVKQQEQLPPFTIDLEKEDKIWSIVKEIKEKDLVYKLLDKIREDLSFDQICQKIADWYNINWHELRHTEFIDANDPRLKRLSNGHFTLAKWFDKPPSIKESENAQEAKKTVPPKTEEAPSGFLKTFWDFCRRIFGLLIKKQRSKE